ncbi:MAG: hypothetical protein ACREUH_12340 [Burkholderiales bacterium]
MYIKNREFGFLCPQFSLGLSSAGFLLPRSRKQLLLRSLLSGAKTRDLTGRYTWEIHHEGAEYWSLPVVVTWARHRTQAEPFLAIKAVHPRLIRQQLKALLGCDVELSFSPRLAPDLLRPAFWK